MLNARIICVGNRFVPSDSLGPAVYDRLCATSLPPGTELVDGGIAGLNLLRFMEGVRKVVVVDSLKGSGRPGVPTVLDSFPAGAAGGTGCDHATGLLYLLAALPGLLGEAAPKVTVVGVEGPAGETAIDETAKLAVCAAGADRGRNV